MLGTLKQYFFLKCYFSPPKCFPNINVAYKRCYFPQTFFTRENVAKKRCKPPQFLAVRPQHGFLLTKEWVCQEGEGAVLS
jgi:hypothetical protein